MLIFGHTGITLGVALVLQNSTFTKGYLLSSEKDKAVEVYQRSPKIVSDRKHISRAFRFSSTLENHIDLRLLLIGSLLPDIIDKPVGQFFFADIFSNGRIFCHTLLFLIAITLAGLYVYQSHAKTWLLVLSFGAFIHLLLDQMWLYPQTLLWPAYGFAFQKIGLQHWMQDILYKLHTDPSLYVPEFLGLAILIWFAVTLLHRKSVHAFIKSGNV